jgi:hypothetical protein
VYDAERDFLNPQPTSFVLPPNPWKASFSAGRE